MAKIDLKAILVAAATAAASQVAADPNTNMKPVDVPDVVKSVAKTAEQNPDLKEAQKTIDVKTNQEPWYLSPQALVSIATALMAVLGIVGLAVPEEVQKEVLAAIPVVVGIVSSALLVWNRYFRFNNTTK